MSPFDPSTHLHIGSVVVLWVLDASSIHHCPSPATWPLMASPGTTFHATKNGYFHAFKGEQGEPVSDEQAL